MAPSMTMSDCVAQSAPSREWICGEEYPHLFGDKGLHDYTTKEVGQEGEHLAALNLALKGYDILERNWRCRYGEADIVAQDGDVVVLVEVKTRIDTRGESNIVPELAVNKRKRERYQKIALTYYNEHPGLYSVRFDVIAIKLASRHAAELLHFESAFSWEE